MPDFGLICTILVVDTVDTTCCDIAPNINLRNLAQHQHASDKLFHRRAAAIVADAAASATIASAVPISFQMVKRRFLVVQQRKQGIVLFLLICICFIDVVHSDCMTNSLTMR